ncbi:helix-turn-helix domain-containing protein [Candidatus Woesearchaeota archaeon]|nr:helix-turn-helix domain-containing protein [Candidatus Woesearchaeota archaeon]
MGKTPQEIEVWYVLPAVRRELAVQLKRNGKSQKEIAELLGITNAAVSQYLKDKRGCDFQFDDLVLNRIKKSVSNITRHPEDLFGELKAITNLIQKTGFLCKLHQKYGHERPGCRSCFVINV